ncbi:hypothetical protein [Nesterenkonia flava]|uniref:Amidohydrolase n=1 Tax=Nesterenkonia flava TaxID=469799 RepID=A0ABU1FRJ7_9MICC|nr:hypothetical protein [Nesterenkonia flava]MDR5711279.1 hypothetical protein [Nesterenkonia flava]
MTLSSTPSADRHAPRLLVNGTIHSTAEPYAEAMLVEDGQIAWLGSDETAERMDASGLIREDLDRALVAPAFVGFTSMPLGHGDSADIAALLDEAQEQGYAVVRLSLQISVEDLAARGSGAVTAALTRAFHAAAAHPVTAYPVVELAGVQADGGAPSIAPVNQLLDLLVPAQEAAGLPAAALLHLSEVLPNLLGVRSWAAEAGHQLILAVGDVAAADTVDAMVTTTKHLRELKQTPRPETPTVLMGFDTAERDQWEALLNTGAHVLLSGPGHLATALSVGVPTSAAPPQGQNPWLLISQHVHAETDPVSGRAGFNAQTRGAYRSLPQGASGTTALPHAAQAQPGALNLGSPATYVVWQVESLAVQAPHSTAAAWSTDTRARTPLLPYLNTPEEQDRLPRIVSTVIAGSR